MCLIWAAFCTHSALTLADGLRLAKTRRGPSEALDILTGRLEGCEQLGFSEPQNSRRPGAKRPPSRDDGGALDEDLTSTPASPSQVPSPFPRTPRQGGDHTEGPPEFDLVSLSPPARSLASRSPLQEAAAAAAAAAGAATPASWGPGGAPEAKAAPAAAATPVALRPPRLSVGAPWLAHAAADLPPPPRKRRGNSGGAAGAGAVGVADARDTNVAHFCRRVEVAFQPWATGCYAAAGPGRKLAKCVHGEVRYLSSTALGHAAVAKVVPTEAVERSRSREVNERIAWLAEGEVPPIEDLRNEIAVLTYLQEPGCGSPYVIRLLGVFRDDSLSYLVTEFCEGGELFERVAYGNTLAEADTQRYMLQLLKAVHFLHERNVGHRDISLENILLRKGNCVLMDFGQAVRLRRLDGAPLRYFAEAGKRMYRAPEMYVPRQPVVQVVCPTDGLPGAVSQVSYDKCRCEVLLPADAVPGKPCSAEPYGYAAAPADVFACGVCAFVLIVGKPPWAVARDVDPTFSFIRRHGVPMLLRQWRGGAAQMAGAQETLLSQMLRTEPARRPLADECLRAAWLTSHGPECE